ncbi:MAG: Hsp20/alpha crystallin family protein [Nanoarchaeota archaeon]|nr:Hsp20/alpha crystallin family protein [Nanoarchaeota archaeon]
MFGNDSFGGIEDLFNQLAGGMRQSRRGSVESRDANNLLLSTIDKRKENILIFDFSGKKVKSVEIKEDSDIDEYGERVYTGNKVLEIRYGESSVLKYVLPKSFKKSEINYTFSNGILEVTLKK